ASRPHFADAGPVPFRNSMSNFAGGSAHDGMAPMTLEDEGLRARLSGRHRFTTSSGHRPRTAKIGAARMAWGAIRDRIEGHGVAGSRDLLSAEVKSRYLEARIRRLIRRVDESRAVSMVRRRPGIAAWCFLFVLVLPQLRVWEGPPEAPGHIRTEHEEWLQDRTEDAVKQVLRVIGNGVVINEVDARSLGSYIAATYTYRTRKITVTSDHTFGKDEMLHTVAHECVHAIFHQAGLLGYYSSAHVEYYRLVAETTADVLGAHIAGRVRSRQGGDGMALTEKLLSGHRDACDWSSPTSAYRRIWDRQAAAGQHAVSPEYELSVSIHFGSTELVDEIDRICRSAPDAWTAAHRIAEEYLRIDEEAQEFGYGRQAKHD
ncbi:MAG: hypothetical protein KAJ43_11205, partial [Gemmatimonadetes bacterium]|nr:hypothetical protein [Gemmatimonadota bacterium]